MFPLSAGATEALDVNMNSGAAVAPLPLLDNGEPPIFHAFSVDSSLASGLAIGDSTVDTATDLHYWLVRDQTVLVLKTRGFTHFATQNAPAHMYIMPLANQLSKEFGMHSIGPMVPDGTNAISDDATAGGDEQAIPLLTNGDKPKYIAISFSGVGGMPISVGQSGITAAADPQYYINRSSLPLILNVAGLAIVAWGTGTGTVLVTPLANHGGLA